MKNLPYLVGFLSVLTLSGCTNSQSRDEKKRILIDLAHKEIFWHDPNDMAGMDTAFVKRMRYMTGEFVKTASAVNGEMSYLKSEIKPEDLAKCDLLFIHFPSTMFSTGEVNAIKGFLNNGGSLFVVMDQDYWCTLEQTNVNDIISPYGFEFHEESPDTLTGGMSLASTVTPIARRIPFHGARIVTGGTPFAVNDRARQYPFGMYAEIQGGGRMIVMGEGMVSLYMTEWQGVKDFQCQEFMQDAFKWLLKE